MQVLTLYLCIPLYNVN